MTAWQRRAEDSSVLPYVRARIRPRSAAGEPTADPYQQKMAAAAEFCKFLTTQEIPGDSNSRITAEWVAFQSGSEQLMQQFWPNNPRDEMADCLRVLNEASEPCRELRQEFRRLEFKIDRVSRKIWEGDDADDFGVAYAFWAFVKGFYFLSGLPSDAVYVPHWLRENAMLSRSDITVTRDLRIRRLFPWGLILSDVVREPELAYDGAAIVKSIEQLRDYTADRWSESKSEEVQHYTSEDMYRIEPFISEGLAKCVPDKWDNAINKARLINECFAALTRIPLLPSILKVMGVNIVKYLPPELRSWAESESKPVPQSIRICRYRETVRRILQDRSETFLDAFASNMDT